MPCLSLSCRWIRRAVSSQLRSSILESSTWSLMYRHEPRLAHANRRFAWAKHGHLQHLLRWGADLRRLSPLIRMSLPAEGLCSSQDYVGVETEPTPEAERNGILWQFVKSVLASGFSLSSAPSDGDMELLIAHTSGTREPAPQRQPVPRQEVQDSQLDHTEAFRRPYSTSTVVASCDFLTFLLRNGAESCFSYNLPCDFDVLRHGMA